MASRIKPLRRSLPGCDLPSHYVPLAAIGTITASAAVLGTLAVIAALAALFPVHPFDLIYNYGIRDATGLGPLPKRGAPSRFACGVGAVWLLGLIWAFESGHHLPGYIFGGLLTSVAVLVATTDICIPSMIYRMIFGQPKPISDT